MTAVCYARVRRVEPLACGLPRTRVGVRVRSVQSVNVITHCVASVVQMTRGWWLDYDVDHNSIFTAKHNITAEGGRRENLNWRCHPVLVKATSDEADNEM